MKSVIFVCLGNICRSSLAEGVAKVRVKELGVDIKIESAGLSTYHNGEAPCPLSIELAKRHGIDISKQVSQHVSEFDLASFDLVVALDDSNKRELLGMGLENVKKLGDFGFDGKCVADLYYEPHKEDEVWEMVSVGVEEILRKLIRDEKLRLLDKMSGMFSGLIPEQIDIQWIKSRDENKNSEF